MKKKLMIVLTCCVLTIACILTLTACASKKAYYTLPSSLPTGVAGVGFNEGGSDSKGNFTAKNKAVQLNLALTEGYEIGTLKLLINGSEIALTGSDNGMNWSYSADVNMSKDFAITFSGETKKVMPTVGLNYEIKEFGALTEAELNRITVEFDAAAFGFQQSGTKFTLSAFKNMIGNGKTGTMEYGKELTFKFYATAESERYKTVIDMYIFSAEEQGEQIHGEIEPDYNDGVLTFKIAAKPNMTLKIKESSIDFNRQSFSFGIVNSGSADWSLASMNSQLFTFSANNGQDEMSIAGREQGEDKLVIGLPLYNNPTYKAYYDQAEIYINEAKQTAVIADGKITLALKRPYTYVENKYMYSFYLYDYQIEIKNVFDRLDANGLLTAQRELAVEGASVNYREYLYNQMDQATSIQTYYYLEEQEYVLEVYVNGGLDAQPIAAIKINGTTTVAVDDTADGYRVEGDGYYSARLHVPAGASVTLIEVIYQTA